MSEIICFKEKPRKGKTTLLVADLLLKLLNKAWMMRHFPRGYWNIKTGEYEPYVYEPEDVYANFLIKIKGVNCITNDEMKAYLMKEVTAQTQKKIVCIDEAAQLFSAMDYHDKKQVKIVRSLQQYPKLYKYLLYCSAPGNSGGVDPNLRNITTYTIKPEIYHHNANREKETIDFTVFNEDERWREDETLLIPAYVQKYFDSRRPVK